MFTAVPHLQPHSPPLLVLTGAVDKAINRESKSKRTNVTKMGRLENAGYLMREGESH